MVARVIRAYCFGGCLLSAVFGCGGDSSSEGGAGEGGTSTAGQGGRAGGGRGGTGSAGVSGGGALGGGTAGGGAASAGESGAAGSAVGSGGEAASAGDSGSGGAANAGVGGTSSAGASASGGTMGGEGGAGEVVGDECGDDEDCTPIVCVMQPCPQPVCVLGSDGYRVCSVRTPLAAAPCEDAPETCCTSNDECVDMPGGECVPYSYGYCGGPQPPNYSTCRYDGCTRDADCTDGEHGVCLLDHPRRCFYGPCSSSADCTEGPGGRCVVAQSGQSCGGLEVFCRYDDDPCQTSEDCPASGGMPQVCDPEPDGHGRRCEPWEPPPP